MIRTDLWRERNGKGSHGYRSKRLQLDTLLTTWLWMGDTPAWRIIASGQIIQGPGLLASDITVTKKMSEAVTPKTAAVILLESSWPGSFQDLPVRHIISHLGT